VRIIETELGQPADVIFDRFDRDPIAVVSLGMSFLDCCQSHPFAPLLWKVGDARKKKTKKNKKKKMD
jgi:hypothetical protein